MFWNRKLESKIAEEGINNIFQEIVTKQKVVTSVERLENSLKFFQQHRLMSVFSSLIATIGILQGNLTIFLVGISLAPFFVYFNYLVVGVFMKNKRLFLASIEGFFGALLLQIFFSLVLIVLLNRIFPEVSISSQEFMNYIDLGNPLNLVGAFVLGFTSLYCFLRFSRMERFVGIGVAFYLIPVLVLIGTALAIGDGEAIITNSLLLVFNFVNLLLGAALAFAIFGFSFCTEE
ncbi:DUF389 domain-containing protein [Candidatus Gracilibacteria bacterium]|nr:DUF389 domain-containing protein [Candidatus Gracilibacteria bacterium]